MSRETDPALAPFDLNLAGLQIVEFSLDPFHTTLEKRALLARVKFAIRAFENQYQIMVE